VNVGGVVLLAHGEIEIDVGKERMRFVGHLDVRGGEKLGRITHRRELKRALREGQTFFVPGNGQIDAKRKKSGGWA
jgi:hypothetical protein